VNVRFLSEARAELDDAGLYYESAKPGLGDEFYAEVGTALAFIVQAPHACPPSAFGTRRKKVHRFPYVLIYSAEEAGIVIAAVAHVRRDPAYWHKRVL
jgi:plasmid stabilization system protein ParE